jgi:hypothetical protein
MRRDFHEQYDGCEVPEIISEIPSEQEPLTYRDAWLDSSSICILTLDPKRPNLFHQEIREAISYLSSLRCCPDFVAIVKSVLLESLKRLNQLPRTDPFWKNTNLRPTTPKLSSYCSDVLTQHPEDVLALLTQAVLGVAHASVFETQCWVRLFKLQAVGIETVAFAAMLLEVEGAPSATEFAVFLTETNTGDDVNQAILKAIVNGGKFLAGWGRSVAAIASLA